MKAVEKVRAENFTYLLAIGGGSVIDGTKFVSAASLFTENPVDLFGWGVGKGFTSPRGCSFRDDSYTSCNGFGDELRCGDYTC